MVPHMMHTWTMLVRCVAVIRATGRRGRNRRPHDDQDYKIACAQLLRVCLFFILARRPSKACARESPEHNTFAPSLTR